MQRDSKTSGRGDGRSTKIWDDPWLDSFLSHRILTPKPQNSPMEWAVHLKEGNQWNAAALLELFGPAEIVAIEKIQIRDVPCQDR